jgi:ABC-type sugar transport system ATPase subunit
MAAIHLEDVSKVFSPGPVSVLLGRRKLPLVETEGQQDEDVHALDRLSLFIPDGTTTVVVGPSGCGKSTLLRVVAGLTDYEGLVAYDDQDMRDTPPGARRIGMVFQNYALYPHFHGHENLSFFFQLHHTPDPETQERIRITSEMMGFGFRALLRRKPGTLSGGQQQRLAIARAVVRQPTLFLFDEPLSNLDAKLRSRTRTEIKRLLHRFGITALYVTHDQTEAMALADQVAVMRAGRIEQTGAFGDMVRDPANLFVAGFLGTPPMNLIQAIVTDGCLVVDELHRFRIPVTFAERVHEGQHVTIGIRPEAAQSWQGGETPPKGALLLAGTIDFVEPDFGRRQQTALVSAGAVSFRITVPLETRLTPGYPVQALLPEEALYCFDTVTEARISV